MGGLTWDAPIGGTPEVGQCVHQWLGVGAGYWVASIAAAAVVVVVQLGLCCFMFTVVACLSK